MIYWDRRAVPMPTFEGATCLCVTTVPPTPSRSPSKSCWCGPARIVGVTFCSWVACECPRVGRGSSFEPCGNMGGQFRRRVLPTGAVCISRAQQSSEERGSLPVGHALGSAPSPRRHCRASRCPSLSLRLDPVPLRTWPRLDLHERVGLVALSWQSTHHPMAPCIPRIAATRLQKPQRQVCCPRIACLADARLGSLQDGAAAVGYLHLQRTLSTVRRTLLAARRASGTVIGLRHKCPFLLLRQLLPVARCALYLCPPQLSFTAVSALV